MAKRFIYLVRHGQREPGAVSDALGPRLTELGWRQAHQTARRLSGLAVDVIHTSSLRRAMETAQILAVEHPNIPIRPSRLLWECVPAIPAFALEWFKDHQDPDGDPIPAEIEPWRGVWAEMDDALQLRTDFEQANQAWEKYFIPAKGKDRHDIIVCHGNLIRYFVTRALQAPPESWINMDIYNCSVCEIVIETYGRSTLVSYNDSGHLLAGHVTLF